MLADAGNCVDGFVQHQHHGMSCGSWVPLLQDYRPPRIEVIVGRAPV
jgi:hypothetical protein